MGPRPAKRVTKQKPRDTDGDGLSDAEERKLGTNPKVFDTDNDGLGDGWESGRGPLGSKTVKTNPLKKDSDGDGLSDALEEDLRSDPNDHDSDTDGWFDGYEVGRGSDPRDSGSVPSEAQGVPAKHLPDFRRRMQNTADGYPDSDKDGVADHIEKEIGTNPRLADTDNDGLSDRVEWLRNTDATSPGKIDPGNNPDYNRLIDEGPLMPGVKPPAGGAPKSSDAFDASELESDLVGFVFQGPTDASAGLDADGDVSGFISEERGQRLADMSDAERGMDVVPPRVRAALGWDDEPAGEVPDLAPPPGDTRIHDHGIYGPDPDDPGASAVAITPGAEPPAEGGILAQVDDLTAASSFGDASSFTTDDTFTNEEPIA